MKNLICIILILLTISCAINPYKSSEKSFRNQLKVFKETISKNDTIGKNSVRINTVNFNLRKPNFVIIHHTAQDSLQQTIKTFTIQKTQVSSHYVISDDGKIVQMLNDYLRAWHAGNAIWSKNTDINSASIGIELDNNGIEPFSEAQINSLLQLLTRLKKLYNIPTQNFIGHSDIAPTRKNDPSILFPWKKLSKNGFGIYPDEILIDAPPDFNPELGLRLIGYDIKNLSDAISAFKRHFIQIEVNDILDQKTINAIYNVYLKN